MRRELCPVETLYVPQRSRAVLSCTLDGPVDTAALAAAFDAVTAEQPTLRARIVPVAGGGHALEPLPEPERPRLTTRPSGEDAYAEELNTPLTVGGPLARAVLIGEPGGHTHTFVLTVDHVITDGHSAITLLNRLWDRYGERLAAGSDNDAEPRPPTWPAPVSTLLPPADEADTAAYLKRRIEETHLRPVELLPYDVPPDTRPSEGGPAHRIEVARLRLDPEDTLRLRTAARTAGLSLHGLIGAALLLAVRRRMDGTGPRVLACMSPVDVRSRLTPPLPADVMVAAVTAHLHALEVRPDSSPHDVARELGAALGDHIERGDHFREMRIMPDVPRNPALQMGTVINTNMGAVSGPRLPDGLRVTDVRLVPAREHYFPQAGRSPLMACVTTFDGRLAIEFPHHTACFSTDFMAALRDEVGATLLNPTAEDGSPRSPEPTVTA
ncbi:phthiocerol/phthiodiolone dimycocerosyl transferase family protein [Streptomyces antibioticus]|uniref:phthiocerol/phthiodiolone dimycocerosyl transferase family protein n=1 Tax=Streptomyces antibioticus TaxID=1890 RepID=UPI00225C13FC|nr:protein kinase [Streptomyces antibioticus]MCX4742173.1 protein kinase [Streptomyces antibioticus]